MPGQRGITRTPRSTARTRRNFNRLAIVFQNQFGDGLTFDSNGRLIVSLDADGGLDFDGAGALGIKLDPSGNNKLSLAVAGLGANITGGVGIAFASQEITLDITNLATATPVVTDELPFFDVGAVGPRKMTVSALTAILDHGSMVGLGDDDHNDATSGYILREPTGTVTDNTLSRWDGTGGRNLQDSGWILDDADTLDAGGKNLVHIGGITFDDSVRATIERGLFDDGTELQFHTSALIRMTLTNLLRLEVDLEMGNKKITEVDSIIGNQSAFLIVGKAGSSSAGENMTVRAGAGSASQLGGNIVIGAGASSPGLGGIAGATATLVASNALGTGNRLGGAAFVTAGNSRGTTDGGVVDLTAGTSSGTGTDGQVRCLTTSSLLLAVGTTAQRPGTPVDGDTRYNSTTNKFEGRENGAWINFGAMV